MLEGGLSGLESVVLSSAAASNAVMLGGGYFNPLTGYQSRDDALSVALEMRTSSGLFWPFPVMISDRNFPQMKRLKTSVKHMN